MQKTDGREQQEHKKEDKTTEEKTDDEEGKRGKDWDHKICVITWNVNKSSAQYDFLSDMAQCQANVSMFQGTQNWLLNGTAEELGWTLLKEQKEGKAAIKVIRQNMSLLRNFRRSTRWVLVVLGSILFLSLFLPHTWSDEVNLEGYHNTVKDLDKNMQEVKQKYHISGIIAEIDAQVEVKPNQEPFVGEAQECLMEIQQNLVNWKANSRACSWRGSRNTRSSWRILSPEIGNPPEQRRTSWTSGSKKNNCRSGKLLITLRFPVGEECFCKRLQSKEPYRSLASGDIRKITTQEGKLEVPKQLHHERMEAEIRK